MVFAPAIHVVYVFVWQEAYMHVLAEAVSELVTLSTVSDGHRTASMSFTTLRVLQPLETGQAEMLLLQQRLRQLEEAAKALNSCAPGRESVATRLAHASRILLNSAVAACSSEKIVGWDVFLAVCYKLQHRRCRLLFRHLYSSRTKIRTCS